MNSIKIILIGITLLIIHDLVLLKYLSDNKNEAPTTRTSAVESKDITVGKEQISLSNDHQQQKGLIQTAEPNDISEADDQQFIESFQRLSKTKEFSKILNDYQAIEASKNNELRERASEMDTSELYTLATTSTRKTGRWIALNQLAQHGGFKRLDTYELKNLYQTGELEDYYKSQILTVLLNKEEPEALDWAKTLIKERGTNNHVDSDMLSLVYQQDPEFIEKLMFEVDLASFNIRNPLYSLLLSEPELNSSFYTKNFDDILKSDNSDLFQYGGYGVSFDMTTEQQYALSELFESNDKNKRHFAANLARNIEDIDTLRRSYNMLKNNREKVTFIQSLFGNTEKNEEQLNLVRELIADSDDPQLALLGRQL